MGSNYSDHDEDPRSIATALRVGLPVLDRVFDQHLPPALRAHSGLFWTPVEVASIAARWIEQHGARAVLDVGSGAGKFAVVAALSTTLDVTGVEQRATLIDAAQTLAETFAVTARVRFVEGDYGAVELPEFAAYYLFNPFGENLFSDGERIDSEVELSFERFRRECRAFTRVLKRAPVGTLVCTFNGFGGRLPQSFKLLAARSDLHCPLRLWRKELAQTGEPDLPEEELADRVAR